MILTSILLGVLSVAPVDELFLKTSAEDSIAELALVKMAVEHTHDPKVKRACQIMIKDHSAELAEIKSLGEKLGVELPSEPNDLHKALLENLEKKQGHDFDKSLTSDQLEDHINDVNTAQDEVEVGVDPSLREFAKKGVLLYAKHEVIWRGVAPHVGVPTVYGRPSSEQLLRGKKFD